MTLRAFLDLPDGMAVRIGFDGLLIGRHRGCDIQLSDETASRRHVLLRLAASSVELVVLGQKPADVNGVACHTTRELVTGDVVKLPSFQGTVRIEQHDVSVPIAYALHRGRDRFHVHATPFVVGSGPAARVVIADWPAEAIRLSSVQGALVVELAAPGGTLSGSELAADTPAQLAPGDAIGYMGQTFVVEAADAGDASTVVAPAAALPIAIELSPLPRGGRILFRTGDGDRIVYLPGRRYQLLAALLQPPAPHAAGDFVPDAVVVPLVWDDTDEVGGRQDINVLLTRCRQDLVAAGIAATRIIERAPGGRATRVVLAAGATVRVRDQG
jgi:hypothetical protein